MPFDSLAKLLRYLLNPAIFMVTSTGGLGQFYGAGETITKISTRDWAGGGKRLDMPLIRKNIVNVNVP